MRNVPTCESNFRLPVLGEREGQSLIAWGCHPCRPLWTPSYRQIGPCCLYSGYAMSDAAYPATGITGCVEW